MSDDQPSGRSEAEPGRLVIVSNRLPIGARRSETTGEWEVTPAAGGLVTALRPVLEDRGGVWIGWPGTVLEEGGPGLLAPGPDRAYALEPVALSEEDLAGYYHGFSNEVLWPLFHDHVAACVFEPRYWESYVKVNQAFARQVQAACRPGDVVWVQDYHLFNVGSELRRRGVGNPLGFFLHIPFPAPDIFAKLPWRAELLRALLSYDLVGVQTTRDRDNLVACAAAFLPGVQAQREGDRIVGLAADAADAARTVRIGAFPISIDFEDFAARAASPAVAAKADGLRREFRGRRIVLGIDRLDYTKGLPQRLAGFGEALAHEPRLRRRITLMQHLVPSREDVPSYREMRLEIEGIVGEINGRFSEPGWVPVHYFYHSLDPEMLSAHYVVADIGLVTPLRDGMNLVAKEFCASHVDERGVLILSEFAGAACQLGADALLVNPYDVRQVAAAILRAFDMNQSEQRARMRRLRGSIRREHVHAWVSSYLDALLGTASRAPEERPRPGRDSIAIRMDGPAPRCHRGVPAGYPGRRPR